MNPEFGFVALIGLAFYAFIIYVALSHVKEMRRQSDALQKIADLLERKQDPE